MQLIFENWRQCIKEERSRFGYSYSFSEIGGEVLAKGHGGRGGADVMYGASMNKPILAFINLILAADGAPHMTSIQKRRGQSGKRDGGRIRRLNHDELSKLITYKPVGWSNLVNRALSNYAFNPKKKDDPRIATYRKLSKEIGVSERQTQEVLARLGLNGLIRGVRWGGAYNKQSPEGYDKFMSLLIGLSNNPEAAYHNQAKEILSYVQQRTGRSTGGRVGRGLKDYLNKHLAKKGFGKNVIKRIYGKGGYIPSKTKGGTPRTSNYSVIINDKYIFSLYGKLATKGQLHKMTLDVISNVFGNNPERFVKTATPFVHPGSGVSRPRIAGDDAGAPAAMAKPKPKATPAKPRVSKKPTKPSARGPEPSAAKEPTKPSAPAKYVCTVGQRCDWLGRPIDPCTNDAACSGDSLCVDGKCVDPPSLQKELKKDIFENWQRLIK